mmetsp:Transcript_50717/g.130678  ORF Transcript_50717/g.130678 Transcript_50717/m.130678 type:complete len:425 (-) Transcript_50717:1000-2274(-)
MPLELHVGLVVRHQVEVSCQVLLCDRNITAVGDQVDLLVPAQLCQGDAEREPQVLDVFGLLYAQHVAMQLLVQRGHVVHLVGAAQQPVEEDAAELRLQQKHLIDRLPHNLPQEGEEAYSRGCNLGAHRGAERLVAGGRKEPEFRVEHCAADVDHELLEESTAVDAALWLAVGRDELHAEHVPQLPVVAEALKGRKAVVDKEIPSDLVPLHGGLRPRPARVAPLLLVGQDHVVQQGHAVLEGQDMRAFLQHRLQSLLGARRARGRLHGGCCRPARVRRRGRDVLHRRLLLLLLGILHALLVRRVLGRRHVGVVPKVDHRGTAQQQARFGDDPRAVAQDRPPPVAVVEETQQRGHARAQGLRARRQSREIRLRGHEVKRQAVEEGNEELHLLQAQRVGVAEEFVVIHRLQLQRVDHAEDPEPHRLR